MPLLQTSNCGCCRASAAALNEEREKRKEKGEKRKEKREKRKGQSESEKRDFCLQNETK